MTCCPERKVSWYSRCVRRPTSCLQRRVTRDIRIWLFLPRQCLASWRVIFSIDTNPVHALTLAGYGLTLGRKLDHGCRYWAENWHRQLPEPGDDCIVLFSTAHWKDLLYGNWNRDFTVIWFYRDQHVSFENVTCVFCPFIRFFCISIVL